MKSFVVLFAIGSGIALAAQKPDVQTIIQKSVEANQRDFEAAPHFNNKERDRDPDGKGARARGLSLIAA